MSEQAPSPGVIAKARTSGDKTSGERYFSVSLGWNRKESRNPDTRSVGVGSLAILSYSAMKSAVSGIPGDGAASARKSLLPWGWLAAGSAGTE